MIGIYTTIIWIYILVVLCFGIWAQRFIRRERKRLREERQAEQTKQENPE